MRDVCCCCYCWAAGASLSRQLTQAEGDLSQHNLVRQRQLQDAQDCWAAQAAEEAAAWEKRLAGKFWFAQLIRQALTRVDWRWSFSVDRASKRVHVAESCSQGSMYAML